MIHLRIENFNSFETFPQRSGTPDCPGLQFTEFKFTTSDSRVRDACMSGEKVRIPILAYSGSYQEAYIRQVKMLGRLFQVYATSSGAPVWADRVTAPDKDLYMEDSESGIRMRFISKSAHTEAQLNNWYHKAMKEEMHNILQDAKQRAPLDFGELHPNCRCVVPVGIIRPGTKLMIRPPARYQVDGAVGWAARAGLKLLGESCDFTRIINRMYDEEHINHVKERVMKIRNRFYVASPHVTSISEQEIDHTTKNVAFSVPRQVPNAASRNHAAGHHDGKWCRKTLADAVAHAQQILEAQPDRDHVAVVQIVRIVRRKKAPVVVEVVK